MKKPTESVTHVVELTYGLPDPLPADWMQRFGHLSVTVEKSERVGDANPGRLAIELSVMPLVVDQK